MNNIDWSSVSFLSTNSAFNLRTSQIFQSFWYLKIYDNLNKNVKTFNL
jgi:hypothetical protein